MSRRRLEADEAKELILAKAKELFNEKGYSHATMDELRKRCDMSKGNLYYHFKKKELIFLELVIDSSTQTMNELDRRLKTVDTTFEKLIKVAEIMGEDCENPLLKHVDEFTKEVEESEELIAPLMKAVSRITDTIGQIVSDGIETGQLKNENPEDMTNAIFSMMNGSSFFCFSLIDAGVNEYVKIHVNNMKSLLTGMVNSKGEII